MRIPISVKIITLTVLIIIVSMIITTRQSSSFFEKVMIQREEYSNFTEADLRSKQIDTLLSGSFDKAKNLAFSILKEPLEVIMEYKLQRDKYLVSVEVWMMSEQKPQMYFRKVQNDYIKKNKLKSDFLDVFRISRPFPYHEILQKNVVIKFTELSQSQKFISIGFPIGKDDQNQVSTYAIAEFDVSMIQELFSNESEREFFMTDSRGQLVAHQNEEVTKNSNDFKKYPLVAKALESTALKKQLTFTDPKTKIKYIGAFVKTPEWGIIQYAQTSIDVILEPAKEVIRKAILVSGVVLSISLFLIFLFSLSLSRPIETLAELIKEIPKGNFNISARKSVTSNDEVGDLAIAFDHMTEGLKERDKVKNVLNKFHGSSIAENLLTQELTVGGTRKEVTVFFSDIRNFTQYSEAHSPEEVVQMLNEYFERMVKIINIHGGVVDKFIGDAIMAVWGVPKGTSDDTLNAVKACLEMRLEMKELNKLRLSRGQEEMQIGMGVHTGMAISGTIGSEERMEFTVIGDTVNVTSRIESSTKHFARDLLFSEEVFQKISNEGYLIRNVGEIEVKGKSLPLNLFTIDDDVDQIQSQLEN